MYLCLYLCMYVAQGQEVTLFLGFFSFFLINLFIFGGAALGLCCYAWAFSSCGEQELLFVAVRVLLIVVASLVAEHGL